MTSKRTVSSGLPLAAVKNRNPTRMLQAMSKHRAAALCASMLPLGCAAFWSLQAQGVYEFFWSALSDSMFVAAHDYFASQCPSNMCRFGRECTLSAFAHAVIRDFLQFLCLQVHKSSAAVAPYAAQMLL
jgi:hypothetical protein